MKTLPLTLLQKPRLSGFIWETFLRYKEWSVTVFLLRCAAISEKISWPLFMKLITDELVIIHQNGAVDWVRMGLLLALGFSLWLLADMGDIAANIISGRRLAAMRADIRLFVLHDLYKQSQQFFHDRFTGSISTSLRDLSETTSDILNEVVYQILPAFLPFFVLGIMFFDMYPGYIALMGVWMVLQVTLVYLTKQKAQQKSREYGDHRSELYGKLIDSVTNYLSVSSFTAHTMEHERISKAENVVIDKRADVVNYTQYIYLATATLEVVFVFGGFVLMYLYLFIHGRATVGDFMFMMMGIYGLMSVVKQISNRVFWLYEQIGIGQEAIEKIIVPHQIQDAENAAQLEVKDAVVSIQDLNFQYLKDKPVLKNVNFTIENGQKVGLVGYSGAGKTTFVSLLMRFYDITSGSITIDGQDIRNVTQESLRRAIALIPQDTTLFHRSLMENIRIARPEATDEEIFEAARLAGAHEFIMNQAKQYDTLVGERGIKLSGGQRQRIAIARAFLKAAPILILDEATSALDSVTEQGIQDALNKVMAGRTTIVIAHRLSTLRLMDRIMVFDQGEVIEDGSHEQLLASGGKYAQMWAMQAGGFMPEHDPVALSPIS
jgi:ATP-binding cassette, subfamily B, bacterial